MLGDVVVGAALAIILTLLFIATIPIAGTRAWLGLWAFILIGGAAAIAVWPAVRPRPAYGLYVVINDSASPVIVQLENPGPYNAWLIDPGEYGPYLTIAIDRAIGIYSSDCEPIGRSRIEGYSRGLVIHPDRSFEVIDLGDLGPPKAANSHGCPVSSQVTYADAE